MADTGAWVQDSRPRELVTTLGPKGRGELGVILPHEHVFLDFRTWRAPGTGRRRRRRWSGAWPWRSHERVWRGAPRSWSPSPWAWDVESTFSPWIPPWVHDAAPEELRDWMIGELLGEIEGTGVRAGWIKVSAGDDGLTETETKILRAAAEAAVATNAVVGSHTVWGRVALEQLDVLEAAGLSPERFVWIHAQREPDFSLHLEVSRRGAWLEYDGIGRRRMPQEPDDTFVGLVTDALHSGLVDRLLLSGDMLGYDASLPNGGEVESYSYLCETFLAKLVAAGVEDVTVRRLTVDNPFDAFAR